jgi:hypothetical protein
MGVDKPVIVRTKGKIWTFHVSDIHPPMNDRHTSMTSEPFYWTADLPELLIKQSHCIKNYFTQHPEKLPFTPTHTCYVGTDKKNLVPLIYPAYYNFKPGDPLPYWDPHTDGHPSLKKDCGEQPRYCGVDAEIEKTPVYDAWCKGIDLADRLIDRRFKNLDSIWTNGLITMYSKPRWLGK